MYVYDVLYMYQEYVFRKSVHFQSVFSVQNVSRSKAYQIIRALNKELKAMGYITIAGKCPIQYFQQKFYGLQMGPDNAVNG